MSIKEYYQTNEAFRAYVDKHAVRGGITVEEALTHQIVKDVWEDMKKESKGVWRGIGS